MFALKINNISSRTNGVNFLSIEVTSVCNAVVFLPHRQVSVTCLEILVHRRSPPVSFTTANMANATKIIQRLRNFLSGVRNTTTDKLYVRVGLFPGGLLVINLLT